MKQTYKISPFIKWAGGKRQLLSKLSQLIPADYNNYYEPFIGGGALLMDLQPRKATINDINSELINVYNQIKNNVFLLIEELLFLDNNISQIDPSSYYYEMRELYNKSILEDIKNEKTAALFIFLNKHCFNGLYRVNSKGLFNVPYNNSIGISFSKENLLELSKYFKNVSILNQDFEKVCNKAKRKDLIFFDSPYSPLNSTTFDAYTKNGFSKDDHIRLANLFIKLSDKGCYCILTNHNTEFINELYSNYNIHHIVVKRMINSNGKKREGKEVIVTNF